MDPRQTKETLDALEDIKCVVDCRARIHEKVVIIDKEIVWYGSLNVLSHTHRTDESMTRVANAGLAQALAANMSKRRVSSETALLTISNAENPRCEACGSRSVYDDGKFGPCFYCESECGWKADLKKMARWSRAKSNANAIFRSRVLRVQYAKQRLHLEPGSMARFTAVAIILNAREPSTPRAPEAEMAAHTRITRSAKSGHQSDGSRRSRNANSVFIGKLKDPAASLSRYPHCRSRR
jgi:hypothetical protein